MSLPLDEPLHAKFLRRPYALGLAPLFEASPIAHGVGLGISIVLAIVYGLWSGALADWKDWSLLDGYADRYAHWGDYPGFWLEFYWQPEYRDLFAHHDYLTALEATTPLGLKGLYFLAARCSIPFGLFQVSFITVLAILISVFSYRLTLSILPAPLAGTIASFLSLQSLWSAEHPLVPDPQSCGYLGLLLCCQALNDRGQSTGLQPITTQDISLRSRVEGLRNLPWPLLMGIGFLSLFSPPYLLLVAGILGLQIMERLAIVPVGRKPQTVQEFLDWSKRQQQRKGKTLKKKTKEKVEWKIQPRSPRLWDLYFPGLALILGIGLIYAMSLFFRESALSRHDIIYFPEFYGKGLWSYFYENTWESWLIGKRSGLIPPLTPPLLWTGAALPFWLGSWGLRQLPLLRQVRSTVQILKELLLVSLVCFVLSHAFILQLGWPQDFLWVSDRLLLVVASSIFLSSIIENIVQASGRSPQRWWGIGLGFITLVIIFKFPFINLMAPANPLPPRPPSALYDRIQTTPGQKILISTLGFQDNVSPEEQTVLNILQTIVPVYITPQTLVPDQKSTYIAQRQHLKDLLYAQYLAPRKDFLAFLDSLTAETQATPFWLLESTSLSPDTWSQYGWLQNLDPDLNRQINKNFISGSPQGFLQQFITMPHPTQEESCLLRTSHGLLLDLSDRCLPES